MLTAAQLRAARALLGWSRVRLARTANISLAVLRRMELDQGRQLTADEPMLAVVRVLEEAGIVFIDANGLGEGVRLLGM